MKGRPGGKLQKWSRRHRACAPGTTTHVGHRWRRRGPRRRRRRQEMTPTPLPPLPPPPGSAHSLAPGGSGGGGGDRCSDGEAQAAARPRSSPAAPRGGCCARPGRPGAEFLNFLGKLWSRHRRSGRDNTRRRKLRLKKKKKDRAQAEEAAETGALRLRPLPGAFACNPAAGGRRRPPPVTSRPLPPLPAPRRARAPAAEAARRTPRPHWSRPRERATPTCREPMGTRLAARQRAPLGPRCSFENLHIPLLAAQRVLQWSRCPRSCARAKGEREESRGRPEKGSKAWKERE